ncbi:hypothetical protein [Dyadobacter sp. CY312]|uniref:hypothetical protein n=1 Tax=Dyadobacter sp. CY312 TaxID=2907303 RepID=UPI001F1C2249|nr:hypothetical protein [Dyadobacter sp. CY312]MCE7042477.1 hypothetical protein [Dyadobacter sp. CY312]
MSRYFTSFMITLYNDQATNGKDTILTCCAEHSNRAASALNLKYMTLCDGKIQSVDLHESLHFYGRKLVKTVTDGK